MVDVRQTREYANYISKIGWIVERIDGVNYFIKKFPLVGSVIKIQRPEKIEYKTIQKLTTNYRTFQVIIEPKDNIQVSIIRSGGYWLSRSPYLPSKTLQINLSLTKSKLINNLKKDARSIIRKTYRKSLFIKPTVKVFHDAWVKSVGFRRYVPPIERLDYLRKAFGRDILFLTSHNIFSNVVHSGAIFIIGTDSCYYWQAFTDKEGRSSLSQYSLLWHGILWAKSRGCRIFDFEGIYDERFPNKSWVGFSHFKKSFGGYEVEYPGAYTKWMLFNK